MFSQLSIRLTPGTVSVPCLCAGEGPEGTKPYHHLVAGLLRDIGIVKCGMGDMAAGCHLMEEAMGLYEWKSTADGDAKSTEVSNGHQETQVAEASACCQVEILEPAVYVQ
jgi:hypothetical protein